MRRAAGIDVGMPLVVYVEDGRIVIETREQLANRIRRDVAGSLDRCRIGGGRVDCRPPRRSGPRGPSVTTRGTPRCWIPLQCWRGRAACEWNR
ncbi:MAG TPA: hypothetical protein VHH53_12060 [Pseudonocardiaceae bacterium]|nr:hypothetical protein [Pseudonocardiaceae bacterium]